MNKKMLFMVFSLVILSLLVGVNYAFADCGGVETSIINCNSTDSGSIKELLLGVIDFLSLSIGIVGVVSIMVVGIIYLTAGDNETQVTKAKKRMFEIVVGLAVYAVIYAGLAWLLPGLDFGTGAGFTPQTAQQNTTSQGQTSQPTNTTPQPNQTAAQPVTPPKDTSGTLISIKTPAQKLNDTANELAWSKKMAKNASSEPTPALKKAMDELGNIREPNNDKYPARKEGKSCGQFVGTVFRYSGIDTKMPKSANSIYKYVKNNPSYKQIKAENAKAGDIILYYDDKGVTQHVAMLVDVKGELRQAEGSYGQYFGKVLPGKGVQAFSWFSGYRIYRFVEK